MKDKKLLMFYEEKCEPCVLMEPLVQKIEEELGVRVDRLEVWDNKENKQLLEKYAGIGMVPFFYNETTGAKISGESDYNTLKNWASGKK